MPNNILYHYTNAESLLNILDSGEMWITKSNYMNDPEEIEYGLKIFNTEINKYKSSDKQYFEPLVNWIKGVHNYHDYFILSLSDNDDSLSLWDRYSNGRGYCIGLDIDEMITELRTLK